MGDCLSQDFLRRSAAVCHPWICDIWLSTEHWFFVSIIGQRAECGHQCLYCGYEMKARIGPVCLWNPSRKGLKSPIAPANDGRPTEEGLEQSITRLYYSYSVEEGNKRIAPIDLGWLGAFSILLVFG